ncbi:hypothetical protein [Kamptonema formosum]|nr:hypothetical protein [Oscillatoria sp. PCC 10802]
MKKIDTGIPGNTGILSPLSSCGVGCRTFGAPHPTSDVGCPPHTPAFAPT